MELKAYKILILFVLSAFSAVVNAAFVDVTSLITTTPVNIGNLSLTGAAVGGKANPLKISFSGRSNVEQVFFSNNAVGAGSDLANQDPTTIGSAIETQFKATSLDLVLAGNISGNSATVMSADPFDYFAVHFGQHELFFHFLTSTNSFTINILKGKAAGLSNYRLYESPETVPVPAAVWLFGSALTGLFGVTRRKSKAIQA